MMIEDAIEIAPRACEEIIGADDACPLFDQALAKVRAEKSSSAGHQHASLKMHREKLRVNRALGSALRDRGAWDRGYAADRTMPSYGLIYALIAQPMLVPNVLGRRIA